MYNKGARHLFCFVVSQTKTIFIESAQVVSLHTHQQSRRAPTRACDGHL
jgi:uncharacterized protein VirK/YbjX